MLIGQVANDAFGANDSYPAMYLYDVIANDFLRLLTPWKFKLQAILLLTNNLMTKTLEYHDIFREIADELIAVDDCGKVATYIPGQKGQRHI